MSDANMPLMSKPCKERPELEALIAKAREAYDAMTPQQKRAQHEAQRRSWVIGEMMLEHPDMTRERAEELYNAII